MHVPLPFGFQLTLDSGARPVGRRAALLGLAALPALAAGGALAPAAAGRARRGGANAPPQSGAILALESDPGGAGVHVDGRPLGSTPARHTLDLGAHTLRLRHPDAVAASYRLHPHEAGTVALRAALWRRAPQAQRVRPPLPGAAIVDAFFLRDGTPGLVVAVPGASGAERELWLLDAVQDGAAPRRVGPPEAGAALALSPDGTRVAYVARAAPAAPPAVFGTPALTAGAAGAAGAPGDEVWLSAPDGSGGRRVFAAPAAPGARPGEAERLVDLAWAPDGRHVLLAARRQGSAAAPRTRLLWLDTAAETAPAREVASLPAEVLPGSHSWSPAADAVAFVARTAAGDALSVLSLPAPAAAADIGGPWRGSPVRYVADLGRSAQAAFGGAGGIGSAGAAAAWPAPAAWSPEGHLAYVAAAPERARPAAGPLGALGAIGSGGPKTVPTLFVAGEGGGGDRAAGAALLVAPAWRPDGTIAALARPKKDGPLALRVLDPDGTPVDTVLLRGIPVRPDAVSAVRWDAARGQALVTARAAAAGGLAGGAAQAEHWLLRFRPEGAR